MTSNTSGEIDCSVCGAPNAKDWLYCQQCGSPLRAELAVASPPTPPGGFAPGHRPDLPPTIVAQPAAPVIPPTIVAQPAVTVPPPVPPTVIAQPAVTAPPPVPPTVIAQPAVIAPPPVPPTVVARSPLADGVDTVACEQCGRVNPASSSFCAGCGAPLPAPLMKTIVRASERPPARAARLFLIQEGGGEGEMYEIRGDELTIGRNTGDIKFPHDGYMSGRHARIVRRGDDFILQDDNSRNGTFKKIDGPVTLKSGDIILIGKQLFRFEA